MWHYFKTGLGKGPLMVLVDHSKKMKDAIFARSTHTSAKITLISKLKENSKESAFYHLIKMFFKKLITQNLRASYKLLNGELKFTRLHGVIKFHTFLPED